MIFNESFKKFRIILRIENVFFMFLGSMEKCCEARFFAFGYTNDIALKIIRMLMSLPLLPAMSMRLGFDELRLYSRRNNVNFESLFSYYERYITI